jgi:hypothetical protein
MSETLKEAEKEITPAQRAAEFVYDLMQLEDSQSQLELFEDEKKVKDKYTAMVVERLGTENPENIIIDARKVDRYRYIASFLGAGFNMSQYDEVTYGFNDDADVGKFVTGYWFEQPGHVQKRYSRSNKMRDEVSEEMFTQQVPTTKYHLGSGMLITSEEDIKAIFEFDYHNLQACKKLDIDLLYERENI